MPFKTIALTLLIVTLCNAVKYDHDLALVAKLGAYPGQNVTLSGEVYLY